MAELHTLDERARHVQICSTRIGVMRALNRYVERVFNMFAQGSSLGRRKLAR